MSASDSLPLSRRSRLLAVTVLTAVLTATGVVAVGAAAAQAAPPAPADLTVTAVTSTSVTLSWTSSGADVAGYSIGARLTYNDVVGPGLRVGAVTTATLPGLAPTGEYSISMSAIDRDGNYSPSSNTILVVTPATDTGPDTTVPGTPTGLRATAMSPTGVTLVWNPATDNVGVTGYHVYKYDGLFAGRLIATVTGTTWSGAPAGDRQYFYVRARDAAGNLSPTSNTAGSQSPTAPPPSTPAPTPTCRVTYQVTSEWPRGFVATLTIANTGNTAVQGWTLGFRFAGGQKVVTSWGSTFTQSGPDVTVQPVRWTRTIAPGGQVGVGLLGTRTAGNPAPTGFTLNGAPCAVG